MVQTTYPGVYLVEKPSGVRTIAGVSTSIGAFFGRASKGPINDAVRIFSFGDYVRNFGDPHPQSDLSDSVRLFFANGGTETYVVRLAHGAVAASVTLQDLNGTNVLVATAKAEGTHGNTIRLEVDYNTPRPDDTFNLRVIIETSGQPPVVESHTGLTMDPTSPRFAPSFVTASSASIDLALDPGLGPVTDPAAGIHDPANSNPGLSQSRRALGAAADVRNTLDALVQDGAAAGSFRFEMSVDGSDWAQVSLASLTNAFLTAGAGATIADIENEIQAAVDTALNQVDPSLSVGVSLLGAGVNRLTFERAALVAGERSSVRIRMGASNDIATALMLGVDQGGFESGRWSNFRPAPTATYFQTGSITPGATTAQRTAGIGALEDLAQNDLTSITIGADTVALDDPTGFTLQTTLPADPWSTDANVGSVTGNNDGVREKLDIITRAINANAAIPFRAERWGYHLALIATDGGINTRPADITAAGPGSADFELTGGDWVANVRRYSLGTASTEGAGFFVTNRVAGDDGTAPETADYLGNEAAQTGLHALDPVDLFNLMVLPGDQDVTQVTFEAVLGPAGVYCRSRRAFLLIDPPKGPNAWTDAAGRPEVVQDTTLVNNLRNLLGAATDHSAVFYPNVLIPNGPALRPIGPSGAIAGLMARTDSSRGVWKAPAGTDARINAINGLEVVLTDAENGVLNPVAANCLRVLPAGFVNWGARTLAGSDAEGSEWKYIPIRRLALFIEESLYRGTHWVVFEPNDEPLWAKIRLNVGAFMTRLFRQGAFQGSSPNEAFFVKCDAETTPQADRDLGIVNIVVGFAPLKPAEFVIITIQQIAGDL